ncbi:hypothetical protein SHIRM173S_06170 [Streptomyces hirsutus]
MQTATEPRAGRFAPDVARGPLQDHLRVVAEAGAHGRGVPDHGDADAFEVGARSDPGQLQ